MGKLHGWHRVYSCAMPKKNRGRSRVEHLIRSIEVRSVHVHMSMHVRVEKGPNPRHSGRAWIEVRGVFDEPVKKQREVVISVHEELEKSLGPIRPAVVGQPLIPTALYIVAA